MFKWMKKWYESKKMSKYYTGIKEMPMYNWIEVFETKSLTPLLKKGKLCKLAEKAYEKIQDELIDNFGVNNDFLRMLKLKAQIELMYSAQIETKDKSNQLFIEIKEIELKELEAAQTKGDIYESIIAIEEHLGFRLDVKKISIFEYYKYSKTIANRLKHGRK